jgi:hypothetical protein
MFCKLFLTVIFLTFLSYFVYKNEVNVACFDQATSTNKNENERIVLCNKFESKPSKITRIFLPSDKRKSIQMKLFWNLLLNNKNNWITEFGSWPLGRRWSRTRCCTSFPSTWTSRTPRFGGRKTRDPRCPCPCRPRPCRDRRHHRSLRHNLQE